MKFELKIECDNDAFGDWPGIEVARILRDVANRVDGDAEGTHGGVRDANGNTVGEWRFA
jgi:hypothetical protein